MKVFYTCSTHQINEFASFYLTSRKVILDLGYELIRDWIPDAIKRNSLGEKEPPRSTLYNEVMTAIKDSDICIFDVTTQTMSLGYQLSFALSRSKPTLLIAKQKTEFDNIENYFIAGIGSGFLEFKNYDSESDLVKIISHFLKKKKDKPKVRFNLVLEKYQNDFIEEKAFSEKTTKTDIIKNILDESIKK